MTTSTKTRDRPVIFTADEVREALAGRLTEFSRPVKPQPTRDAVAGQTMWGHKQVCGLFAEHVFGACFAKLVACPFGGPGTMLWVRETFITGYDADDSGHLIMEDEDGNELPEKVWYRATEDPEFTWLDEDGGDSGTVHWRSSATMRREYSRLRLEVTGVRVERVDGVWRWVVSVKRIEGQSCV